MVEKVHPRYPIYIPSKGRARVKMTAAFMTEENIPFRLVVEPQDVESYAEVHGADRLLVLPENNRGLIYARNWIFDHAISEGHRRHWQIDDNIRHIKRWYRGKRIRCDGNIGLRACEDFVDRYTNVAIAGLDYTMFGVMRSQPPFCLNKHVYSCTLILNEIPYRFREPANEDVDMCLQVLSGGWCTVQFKAFLVEKVRTMTVKGGQTDHAYQKDGRLFMSRVLESRWPGVVTTKRRFGRAQHTIIDNWHRFDNKLIRDPAVAIPEGTNEYGMVLEQVGDTVRSERLKELMKAHREETLGVNHGREKDSGP